MSSIAYCTIAFERGDEYGILVVMVVKRIITEGINWAGWFGVATVLFLVVAAIWFFSPAGPTGTPLIWSERERPAVPLDPSWQEVSPAPATTTPPTSPGQYLEYSSAGLATVPEGNRIVLFFSSDRCQSCQVAERNLLQQADMIPVGLYIFRIDFDRALTERRRYAISSPHTFIEIDPDGRLLQRWSASRDLQSILARVQP